MQGNRAKNGKGRWAQARNRRQAAGAGIAKALCSRDLRGGLARLLFREAKVVSILQLNKG